MMKSTEPRRDETLDTLFGGRVSVLQGKGGYRFSLDAVLLTQFVNLRRGDRVFDLGSGNGVIPLLLASLHPSVRVTGLEFQRSMVHRALRSVAINDLTDRVEIRQGDVRSVERQFAPREYDMVVSNPPYRKLDSGRVNPDPERYIARHEAKASLADFLRAGAHLLRSGGKMALVYPATRANDLLVEMRNEDMEPKRVRFVHSFAGGPATLILAEGIKGARSDLKVMAPLVVYSKGKQYTGEVSAMLNRK